MASRNHLDNDEIEKVNAVCCGELYPQVGIRTSKNLLNAAFFNRFRVEPDFPSQSMGLASRLPDTFARCICRAHLLALQAVFKKDGVDNCVVFMAVNLYKPG